MPHFSFRRWKDESYFQRDRSPSNRCIIASWMSIQRESDRTKPTTTKAEEKVQITKEEEKSIQDVMEKFVRTTNEKILLNIWSYFQRRCPVLKT